VNPKSREKKSTWSGSSLEESGKEGTLRRKEESNTGKKQRLKKVQKACVLKNKLRGNGTQYGPARKTAVKRGGGSADSLSKISQ